jgi:hypothetical protein
MLNHSTCERPTASPITSLETQLVCSLEERQQHGIATFSGRPLIKGITSLLNRRRDKYRTPRVVGSENAKRLSSSVDASPCSVPLWEIDRDNQCVRPVRVKWLRASSRCKARIIFSERTNSPPSVFRHSKTWAGRGGRGGHPLRAGRGGRRSATPLTRFMRKVVGVAQWHQSLVRWAIGCPRWTGGLHRSAIASAPQP